MKIFISYVREDEKIAKQLFKDLKRRGLMPWINTEAMLLGQEWKKKLK